MYSLVFLLPEGHCRIIFKTYTVKLGNTAICKSGNEGVRKVVLAFFSRVKMRQNI